jgi:hypothetical protein
VNRSPIAAAVVIAIGALALVSLGTAAVAAGAGGSCNMRLESRTALLVAGDQTIEGRRFGGVSGLDFDPVSRRLLFISDDRSEPGEAMIFASAPIPAADETAALRPESLLRLRGLPGTAGIDFEALRTLPAGAGLLVASEGGVDSSSPAWIALFDRAGQLRWRTPLPAPLDEAPHNRSIESLALDEAGGFWIALENPLPGDGPQGDATRGADVRIARLDFDEHRQSATVVVQQAYRTEPAEPASAAGVADIGVSEILVVNGAWWVMERSGTPSADGRYRFRSRLFCVAPEPGQTAPLKKTLLFDSRGALDPLEANLEAMALIVRPGLPPMLVIANDNNFAPGVATRVLAFDVLVR